MKSSSYKSKGSPGSIRGNKEIFGFKAFSPSKVFVSMKENSKKLSKANTITSAPVLSFSLKIYTSPTLKS